jgi:DNA-binding transcriptional MerR regulator
MVKIMDIADVRSRTGLSAAALHHYEEVGLITPVGRTGLRRQYGPEIVEALAVIALCQSVGFSLQEIGELMVRRHDLAWKSLVKAKLDQTTDRLRMLEQTRDGLQHALDCSSRDIMRCEHFRFRLGAVYPEPSTV